MIERTEKTVWRCEARGCENAYVLEKRVGEAEWVLGTPYPSGLPIGWSWLKSFLICDRHTTKADGVTYS